MDPDLSLVSTDDLWAEIKRRSDTAILVFHKERSDEAAEVSAWRHGWSVHAMGLAEYARQKFYEEMRYRNEDGE